MKKKNENTLREKIEPLLFDGSRLRFNYCTWLDLWLWPRVAFEKDYIFPVSENFDDAKIRD